MYKVTHIQAETEFQRMKQGWNLLAEKCVDGTSVFLRHEWFDSAWQWARQNSSLYIVCVYRENILVGVCPLLKRNSRRSGINIILLEFLAVPDTQVCDILLETSDAENILNEIFSYLNKFKDWDVLYLSKLSSDTKNITRISSYYSELGYAYKASGGEISSGITLDDTWEDYYSRRSRRLKKGNNHIANKLKKTGTQFRIEHYGSESGDIESVLDILQSVINISASSWKKETGLSLENPGPGAFIAKLTEHAYKHGWLSIWLLYLDDTPVAMEYQLSCNGVVSALRADYNMDFDELSPGTYLNWKLLEQLFHDGLKYYNMGPGSNEYKKRWAEDYQELHSMTIYNKTMKGRMLNILEIRIKPMVKMLLGK